MAEYKHKLSKSRFLSGVQCPRKLYYDLYRPDLKPEVEEAQQQRFDLGHTVGSLAQMAFPRGRDATPKSYYDFSDAIKNTRSWIDAGIKTIYEAAFFHDEVLAALDILHHQRGKRWAIEVKSTASVKDYHLTDASLQYWVMKRSGFAPHRFFLMHLDTEYVREGSLNPKALFHLEDITLKFVEREPWVEEQLDVLKQITKAKEPEDSIGPHCSDPFECEYHHHCWRHVPEKNSVFELGNARGKHWQLYEEGILSLTDIPDDFKLTERQRLQVNGVKHGASYIDRKSIADFLKGWKFPLYFFDFETIFPALPVMDGTSPFQQVPFQYSLHVLRSEEAPLEHYEFLANAQAFTDAFLPDPRKALLEQLQGEIGKKGNLVAYNAPFEISRLKELANAFPEYRKFVDDLITRFVDLLLVFRNGWYYTPDMGASASIKFVLPAIAPELSYEDLEIGNGGDASAVFLALIEGTYEGDPLEARKALLAYCQRDTYAMMVTWKKLREVMNDRDA